MSRGSCLAPLSRPFPQPSTTTTTTNHQPPTQQTTRNQELAAPGHRRRQPPGTAPIEQGPFGHSMLGKSAKLLLRNHFTGPASHSHRTCQRNAFPSDVLDDFFSHEPDHLGPQFIPLSPDTSGPLTAVLDAVPAGIPCAAAGSQGQPWRPRSLSLVSWSTTNLP